MAATLIYGDSPFASTSAQARGEDLWISFDELTAATGWERKPQGFCLGDRCIPIPPNRQHAFFGADERFNLAEFARYLDQPVVHDDASAVWLIGEAAGTRRDALRSLAAPDFRLPDLDGASHALSDYRGKKVLLLSWASW